MSERDISSSLKTGAQSAVHAYVVLVDLDFPSGNVRAHNGVGTYKINGDEFLGVGSLGGVEAMEETVELIPPPFKLILSSVDADIMTAVRNDNVYGRQALVYVGELGEDFKLLDTPDLWIRGRMIKKEIVAGENNAVSISIESSAARLSRRNGKRYSLEDHQIDYPGDKFFEFMPYVVDAKIIWAGEPVRGGQRNTDDGLLPGGGRRRPRRGDRRRGHR